MPFVIAKFNEHGALTNPDALKPYVEDLFAFTDVFLSAHGWWTTLDGAEQEYTRFRNGFWDCLAAHKTEPNLSVPPDDRILAIGIAWPAMVATALGPFNNIFEAFSYPEIKDRSEWIANTGVMDLIRKLWRRSRNDRQMNIHLLGHSMGCRVICQALTTALLADSRPKNPDDPATAPLVRILPNVKLDVVLFEGAIDNNTLDRLRRYGVLSAIDGLRVMVTCSDLDRVLQVYPSDDLVSPAMGAKGPSAGTFTDQISQFYNQHGAVDVGPGFDYPAVAALESRFIVADLTRLHRADRDKDPTKWGSIFGSHSDIFEPEIYELVAGFLFGSNKG